MFHQPRCQNCGYSTLWTQSNPPTAHPWVLWFLWMNLVPHSGTLAWNRGCHQPQTVTVRTNLNTQCWWHAISSPPCPTEPWLLPRWAIASTPNKQIYFCALCHSTPGTGKGRGELQETEAHSTWTRWGKMCTFRYKNGKVLCWRTWVSGWNIKR